MNIYAEYHVKDTFYIEFEREIMNDLERNNMLLESCIKSNEKLFDTLDNMQSTMVTIADSVKQNQLAIQELVISTKQLSKQIKLLTPKSNIINFAKRGYKALMCSIYQLIS